MSAPKPRLVQVAIKAPSNVNDLITHAKTVLASLTGNPHVPSTNPSLAVFATQIADLETWESNALTKVKGAVPMRNAKERIVLNSLHSIKGDVQLAADADPSNAEAIITGAGLAVKAAKAVHTKVALAAKVGTISGMVKLIAMAAARRASYDWQWSSDQKTWIPLPSTLQAHTTVTGLPVPAVAYFRHRAVTKAGAGDWGQVVSLLVT